MRKKLFLTGSVCFLLPVVAFVLLIHFGMNEVELMSLNQRLAKTENYALMSEDGIEEANVFFGDSITELCPLNEIYADYIETTGIQAINRGISGEMTQTMLERIETNVLALKPRNLIMLMGVNDLAEGGSQEVIVENISKMIDLTKQQSPNTNIILEAVYPINISDRVHLYEKIQIGNRTNEMIIELNNQLKQLAEDKKIIFLDVNASLVDEKGELKEAYTSDGLHPNIEGYKAVSEKIVEVLK